MRVVSLLIVLWSCSVVVSAQEANQTSSPAEPNIPTTLAEAYAALERMLSPETLAEIDAMASEDDMIQYHMGLGTGLRNSWGLWHGSALAKHLQELGFTHPDDMSGVILETFWCKRHGQPFRLEERAAAYKKFAEIEKKEREEEEIRVQKAKTTIRNSMMNLRFEKRDVPVARIPIKYGMEVRFMRPFRGGVFVTSYCRGRLRQNPTTSVGVYYDPATNERRIKPEYDDGVRREFCYRGGVEQKIKPGDDFYIQGSFLDLTNRRIRRIQVAEVNEVYAAMVAGGRAWFAGLTDGKAALVGVGERDRIVVSLPQDDEIPDLGIDGQSLLAVYPRSIYRLTDQQWELVHSGDILLPRSGLPPQRHGNRVFLREEDAEGRDRRLWWLTMGNSPHLSVLDRDAEAAGLSGLAQRSSCTHCLAGNGDLWASVGPCGGLRSLFRRSRDGDYSIAIVDSSVRYTEDQAQSRQTEPRVSISVAAALSGGALLLAGDTGLYRLKNNELIQEVAFVTQDGGRDVSYADWDLQSVLVLDEQSYLLGCGSYHGVYLLRKGDDGQWSCLPVYEDRDTPVVVW
jgi:hypothetical protein